MTQLSVRIDSLDGTTETDIPIDKLVVAGWTGRQKEAMEHHIAELEALGIKRPAATPMFYLLSASRLTQSDTMEVIGDGSSGEAEFVLLGTPEGLLVGIGSDHTDREAETVGVTLSKQMCDKPVGGTFWRFDDLRDHWDQIIIRSFATIDGARVLYQEGTIAGMLAPQSLIAEYEHDAIAPGTAMFCGTLPAIGGIRGSSDFTCELEDPVLNRKITCHYAIKTLEVRG
ncbi:DUF2848 domain-containing protein [Pseudooceanicola aestuarii]|uniref:DUF2848 domain-containing protein n=1 Tax=Pseudooceanicola aestuarii TaxID=2697319 RepID=UPI0013D487A6|nr:DUF2848 domain-containing protein [Pseudooceanicola aestuarii]